MLLWLTALPLAALGAWWCATRLSERRWPPVLAALLWMLAPPLLSALSAGRPSAVLLHLLLPWLVLAALEGARSWSASAAASLLFAAATACAPVLAPALVVAVVAWAFARPRGFVRVIGIPIPAIALFAPLVVTQLARGNPLGAARRSRAAVTVPGCLRAGSCSSACPRRPTIGWAALASAIGLPGGLGVLAPAVLLAPLAAIALLAVFLPGSRRAIPAMVVALLGLITAVASAAAGRSRPLGPTLVTPWPGTGLSLYWLGLVGAAVVALDALGSARVVVGIAVLLTAGAAVAPLLAAPAARNLGGGEERRAAAARAGDGRGRRASRRRHAGARAAAGRLGRRRRRSRTRAPRSTRPRPSGRPGARWMTRARDLATLAGNLSSRSGFDPVRALGSFRVEFVLLPAAEGGATAVRQRLAESLDATPALTPVGETAVGTLWRVQSYTDAARPGHGTDQAGGRHPDRAGRS